jgi:hypothetical protein
MARGVEWRSKGGSPMEESRKKKTVYSIVERDGRYSWCPLGVGFVNADGSIDVRLDGSPRNGALRLRDATLRALEGGT